MAHLFCKNTTFTSYDKIEKILSKTEKQIKKYITSDPDEISKDQFKVLYNSSIVQQIEEFFKLNILAGYHLDNDIKYTWILAFTPKI